MKGWTKYFKKDWENDGWFVPLLGSIVLSTITGLVTPFFLHAWFMSVFYILLAVVGSGLIPMIVSMLKARRNNKSPFLYSEE